jgi:mRNA interferase RelE/StbE
VIPKIENAIERLATDPRPRNCKKLKERTGWRIRVGDYRVIYEIDDRAKTVVVMRVRHRSDVYR